MQTFKKNPAGTAGPGLNDYPGPRMPGQPAQAFRGPRPPAAKTALQQPVAPAPADKSRQQVPVRISATDARKPWRQLQSFISNPNTRRIPGTDALLRLVTVPAATATAAATATSATAAATAAVATATAAVAATTAAAVSAAITTRRTFFTGTRNVYAEIASIQILVVEHFNGTLCFLVGAHFNEGKSAGTAGELVEHQLALDNGSGLREQRFK